MPLYNSLQRLSTHTGKTTLATNWVERASRACRYHIRQLVIEHGFRHIFIRQFQNYVRAHRRLFNVVPKLPTVTHMGISAACEHCSFTAILVFIFIFGWLDCFVLLLGTLAFHLLTLVEDSKI